MIDWSNISELNQMIKKWKQIKMSADIKKLQVLVIKKLPEVYHDYMNVFFKVEVNNLALHRSYNHKIVLNKSMNFSYSSLYKMSIMKLQKIRHYLKDNLNKEFIVLSETSFISLILFIQKKNDSLWFCVNYWRLNFLIKKN